MTEQHDIDNLEPYEFKPEDMPYPMPTLDKFVNPFNEATTDVSTSGNPWSVDYWLDKFMLYLIKKELIQDQMFKKRKQIRSLKSYFSNFNNENIPSIWQLNSFGDRIRNIHVCTKDRIMNKNKKTGGFSDILNNLAIPASYQHIPDQLQINSKHERLPQ